jgi:hypothetical protein
MTPEQRQEEILRLKRVRDRLLNDAPKHFYLRRMIIPIILALVLMEAVVSLRHHRMSVASGLVLGALCAILLFLAYRFWINPPMRSDRWGYSDTLGYEGDSPRDIQEKIEALRAASDDERR